MLDANRTYPLDESEHNLVFSSKSHPEPAGHFVMTLGNRLMHSKHESIINRWLMTIENR
jgi:hypothetical protein